MRLTVVGCSGSFPGPESAASCYLVQQDDFTLVLELGSGAIRPLQRYTNLDSVDAVFVSHLHADHCADLCVYYVARRYHPGGLLPPLDVYAPTGAAAHVARSYGGISRESLAEIFTFHEVGIGTFQLGPLTVTAQRTAHPVECYAVRLEAGGTSLVFTADTGPSVDVESLASGADLLLAEASFLEGTDHPDGLHLTARQAGELARAAGVGRLVVTHVPPWNDVVQAVAEAEAGFGRSCGLARSGAEYEV